MKNAVIEWTLQLTRERGAALTLEEIQGIEIAISGDNGANWSVMPSLFPAATLTTTVADMDIGTYIVRGVVIDTNNERSQPLTESFVVIDESPPSALGSITVTLS